jgi:predicted DNA-binding ribbon-helix-helix protein
MGCEMPITRRPQHAVAEQAGPSLVTRNLRLDRGRTSIRLEQLEWAALDTICQAEGVDRHAFASLVDRDPIRGEKTLTSRVRSAILTYFVARAGLSIPGMGTGIIAMLGRPDVGAAKPGRTAAELEEKRS